MPITSSAKKALRQNKKNKASNTIKKEAYKKAVKNYRKLVTSKKPEDAISEMKTAFKALDKAARTNVITKNKASRLKSRLAKALAKK
jgi:small subunit ribosomal protein S20